METNKHFALLFQHKIHLEKCSTSDDKNRNNFRKTYLSSVALPLPLGLVALQVGLLQGEATHPAAQGEEEDGERGRGRAEAPKRLEVT